MLPVEESDDEGDRDLAVTDSHPNSFQHSPSMPSFSSLSKKQKRYSNIYETVSLSSLAAAAAKEQELHSSSALLESLLDPNVGANIPPIKPFGNQTLSSSHSSSSLRSNQLRPKTSSSSLSLGPPPVSSLMPPNAPYVAGHRRTVSTSSSHSNHWQNNNNPYPAISPSQSFYTAYQLANPAQQQPAFDPAFLPPPPLPPFAGGSASAPINGNSTNGSSAAPSPTPFRPSHSTHSSISSTYSFTLPPVNPYESASTSRPSSPSAGVAPARPISPGQANYQPFNFQSTTMALAPPPASRPNQRRGHKYKHSSVSLNFFKEDIRVPLQIPASLPIPTFSECRQSMSKDQIIRVLWGLFHLYVAFLIYIVESPYTALSALAHLLFYDAMGAFLCAFVDILSNFDVWKRSSVHLPFGLERAEVLAGYALAISLVFMGGDILSHSIQDIIQAMYLGDFFAASHGHGASHHGHHGHEVEAGDAIPAAGVAGAAELINWRKVSFRVVLGIIATVVSAVGFDNHARISRALKSTNPSAFSSLPWILSNPSHFITVTFSVAILLYPVESAFVRRVIDTILTPVIAASMCYVGWILAKSLGGMLVMSFPGENRIQGVEEQVLKLPHVQACSEVSVWQVHHSVWLACMKIEVAGSDADEQLVREQAARLVKEIMGDDEDDDDGAEQASGSFSESLRPFKIGKPSAAYAYNDQIRWEVTIDITRK